MACMWRSIGKWNILKQLYNLPWLITAHLYSTDCFLWPHKWTLDFMKIIGKSKDAPFWETRRLSVPGPQSQEAVCNWKCGRPFHQPVPHVVTIRRKMSTMCQNQLALSYLWRTIHSVLTQDIRRPGIIKTIWTYSPIPQFGENSSDVCQFLVSVLV